ncbi:MAG TPA: hypothetical protein PKG52_10285 [bacterium]|nr:hypothetical protein [bacterium]HPS31095.1 hypothetical protein [bacterium]
MIKITLFIQVFLILFSLQSEELKVESKDSRFVPIKEKVSVFVLKNSDSIIYRTVNIAIGEVFVIEFPKNISLDENPTVGDAGLLKIEVETDPLKMKIWGLMFPESSESSMYGLSSNIQFKINSGQTFIFNLILQPAENASNRIIFSYPEWENAQKSINNQLETLKKMLNQEYEKKMKNIDKESEKMMVGFMAESFSEFFQCNNYSARTEDELVFLRSDRICKIGKDGIVAVNFSIKNRNRQRFHVESVKIYNLKGGKVELDNAQYHLDKFSMQFDEIVNGALAFRIKDEDYSTEYIIEVIESAGKKRKIDMKVSF